MGLTGLVRLECYHDHEMKLEVQLSGVDDVRDGSLIQTLKLRMTTY